MRRGLVSLPIIALAVCLCSSPGSAQGNLYQKVVVEFANPVHIGDKVVPAGKYQFQPLQTKSSGQTVMIVAAEQSLAFETSVIPIPTISNNTPEKTSFSVRRLLDDYYLDRLYIAGNTYGYEFEIPYYVKSRMAEQRDNKRPVNIWMLFTAPAYEGDTGSSSGNRDR